MFSWALSSWEMLCDKRFKVKLAWEAPLRESLMHTNMLQVFSADSSSVPDCYSWSAAGLGLGPQLFCTLSLGDVIQFCDFKCHLYANDFPIYISNLSPELQPHRYIRSVYLIAPLTCVIGTWNFTWIKWSLDFPHPFETLLPSLSQLSQ